MLKFSCLVMLHSFTQHIVKCLVTTQNICTCGMLTVHGGKPYMSMLITGNPELRSTIKCKSCYLLLQKFMSQLHQNFFGYCKYFKTTYANRLEQWATCFRVGCVVNTKIFIESFHRLLKVVYLQSKQNRQIDDLWNT